MKKARTVRAALVEVECPCCGYGIENPNDGSMMWMDTDWIDLGETLHCTTCGETVKAPANPFARKTRSTRPCLTSSKTPTSSRTV